MGVFDAFAAAGGAELTIDQLDEKTKGDKDLLGKMIPPLNSTQKFGAYWLTNWALRYLVRIMRLLSAHRFFTESELHRYQPQPLALGFATGAPPCEVIKNL